MSDLGEKAKNRIKKLLKGTIESVVVTFLLIVAIIMGILYALIGLMSGLNNIDGFDISSAPMEYEYLGDDLIVYTDNMPEIVLTRDQLETGIKSVYSGQRQVNLLSVLDDLMQIQENNKVNAVFAIAVFNTESGCGTGWDLIDSSTHNWQSVNRWAGGVATGTYTDRNGTVWASFDSFNQATQDFGIYISTHSAYFQAGKYKVMEIAPIYCDDAWGETVLQYMKEFLVAAGIDLDAIMAQYNSNTYATGKEWWVPTTSSMTENSVSGVSISSRFNATESIRTNPHGGLDLIGGVRVIASRSGTVTKAGTYGDYGNLVVIDHGDGFESYYAHMKDGSLKVREGDTVSQGDDLGIPGATGFATGVHLHFEIRENGVKKDPENYISLSEPYLSQGGTFNGDTFTDSNGKVFKLYKQNGDEYRSAPYPARGSGATVGNNGCGPTSCCIISSAYGYHDDPASLVAGGANYSVYNYIMNYFTNRGFTVEFNYSLSDSGLKDLLRRGYKIVVLSDGGYVGCYSLGRYAHWYTILGVNESGDKVFVGDPLIAGGGWFSTDSLTNRSNYICVKK